MTSQAPTIGRGFRLLGKALFSVLIVCCLTNAACPRIAESLPEPEATPFLALGNQEKVRQERPKYDVKPRNIDLIPPGTVIGKEPPKGWSHLILKSQPRAAAGDFKKMPDSSLKLCALLFTAIVANVQQEKSADKTRYRLSGLAIGLGTRIGDKDTIISPQTFKNLGAKLPLFGPAVLTEGHKKLQDVTIVARSDTMAIVDAYNYLVRDGKHVSVALRHVILVDAATGKLATLLWAIDRDAKGNYKEATGPMQWLPASKLFDCVLHVDGKEINSFGVPSDRAFAVNKMMEGQKQVQLADGFKESAARARLTADAAYELETKLREALKKAAK
jgi:hypothetical protein